MAASASAPLTTPLRPLKTHSHQPLALHLKPQLLPCLRTPETPLIHPTPKTTLATTWSWPVVLANRGTSVALESRATTQATSPQNLDPCPRHRNQLNPARPAHTTLLALSTPTFAALAFPCPCVALSTRWSLAPSHNPTTNAIHATLTCPPALGASIAPCATLTSAHRAGKLTGNPC